MIIETASGGGNVRLIAFDNNCALLEGLGVGDCVVASGTSKPNCYDALPVIVVTHVDVRVKAKRAVKPSLKVVANAPSAAAADPPPSPPKLGVVASDDLAEARLQPDAKERRKKRDGVKKAAGRRAAGARPRSEALQRDRTVGGLWRKPQKLLPTSQRRA